MAAASLFDCRDVGPDGTEVILVEGQSAAHALARVRDPRSQAVFALQGKLINAERASIAKIRQNVICRALFDALACGVEEACDLAKLRYGRVLIAADPNPDGAHICVLVLRLIERMLAPLVDGGRVGIVQIPVEARGLASLDSADLNRYVLDSGTRHEVTVRA